jgi:PAS domain S-box-containing protein
MDVMHVGTAPDRVQQRSLLWSTMGLAMLVAIALIALLTLRQVNESDRWVDHTREVISSAEHLLSDLKDARNGELGYVLTGREAYLATYTPPTQDIAKPLANLRQLTADNAGQQRRLDELEPLIAHQLTGMAEAMRQRRVSGLEAARTLVLDSESKNAMDRIRRIGQDIQREEYGLLRSRLDARKSGLRTGFIATVAASALAVLSLVIAPFDVRRVVRQRDRALQQQNESRAMTHALFEAAAEAIFIVDRHGRVLMTNMAASRMFRYEHSELLGQPVEALMPEQLRHGHTAHRDRYFQHPQTRPMGQGLDLRARRKDGTEFYSEISLSHIRTEQGAFAVVFVTDISKRHAYKDAMLRNQQELRALAGRLLTAQDDERRRIARNLHDDLTQQLAFLAIDLGKLGGATSGEAAAHVRSLQQRAADAAENVRQISHQLHPSILDDIGLEAALEQYCQDFSEHTGITTEFRARHVPERLPQGIASSLYHIAQESLRNVSKHASAEQAWVSIEQLDHQLHLTVRDNGIGMPEERINMGKRIGVASMKERAYLVKGELSITSEQGKGTQLSVVVPLAPDEGQA